MHVLRVISINWLCVEVSVEISEVSIFFSSSEQVVYIYTLKNNLHDKMQFTVIQPVTMDLTISLGKSEYS